jgi:DNA-3-methyladenine glycosylase I
VEGKPKLNHRSKRNPVPASSLEAQAMSKALQARGFRFVGPTICYAFMQAVGLVNDHTEDCFRYKK